MSEHLVNHFVDQITRTPNAGPPKGLDEDMARFLRHVHHALQPTPPSEDVLVRIWQEALHNATIVAKVEQQRQQMSRSSRETTRIFPIPHLVAASRTVAIVASVAVLVFVAGIGIYFQSDFNNTATQGEDRTTVPPTVTIPDAITCQVGDEIDVPVTYRGDFMDATSSDSTVVAIRDIVDDGLGSGYVTIHCRTTGETTLTVLVLPSEEGGVISVTVLSPDEGYPLPRFITVPTSETCSEGEATDIHITFEPAPDIGPPIGVAAISGSHNVARIQRSYSDQTNSGTVTIDCLTEGQSTITLYIFRIGDVTLDDFSKAASTDVLLTVKESIVPTPTVPTPVIVTPGANPSPTNRPPRRAPSVTPTASTYVKPGFIMAPPASLECVVGEIRRIDVTFQAAPGFPGDIGLAADLSGNTVMIQQASTDGIGSGYVEFQCTAAGPSTVIIQIFRVGDVTETDMRNANTARTTVNVVEASPTSTGATGTPTPTPQAYVKPSYTSPPPATLNCETGEIKTISFGFQAAPGFGGPIGVTARSATPSAVLIQSTNSDEVSNGSVTIQCVSGGASVVTTYIFRIGDISMEDFSNANPASTTVTVTAATSPPTFDLPATYYCGSPDYVEFHAYALPQSSDKVALHYTVNADPSNYQVGRADSFWNGEKQVLSLAYGCSRPGTYTITFEAFHYITENNEIIRTSDSAFDTVTVNADPANAAQLTSAVKSQTCTVGEQISMPLTFTQSPVLGDSVEVSASSLQTDIVRVIGETSDGFSSAEVTIECVGQGTATVTIQLSNRNSPPSTYHKLIVSVSE